MDRSNWSQATEGWPSPDLAAHAATLRAAVRTLRADFREVSDHVQPILEVADALAALAAPIRVTP